MVGMNFAFRGFATRFGGPGVKANLPLRRFGWRWRRVEDVHDALQHFDNGALVHVEPGGEFGFKRLQLFRQFPGAGQHLAHLHEGAHDEDAHLDGSGAGKHVRRHYRAVLGEGIGEVFAVPAAPGL